MGVVDFSGGEYVGPVVRHLDEKNATRRQMCAKPGEHGGGIFQMFQNMTKKNDVKAAIQGADIALQNIRAIRGGQGSGVGIVAGQCRFRPEIVRGLQVELVARPEFKDTPGWPVQVRGTKIQQTLPPMVTSLTHLCRGRGTMAIGSIILAVVLI